MSSYIRAVCEEGFIYYCGLSVVSSNNFLIIFGAGTQLVYLRGVILCGLSD